MVSAVASYVAERTGCQLSKQQEGRLRVAVRERLGARSEFEYLAFLKSAAGAVQLAELMAAVAVHKTSLFRDEAQLEQLSSQLLPGLLAQRPTLHVWSAGCATGEEVATLLVLLAEAGASADTTVLGTDISDAALQKAQALTFAAQAMRNVSESFREKYFRKEGEQFRLVPALKSRASFLRHNLMDRPYPLPPEGAFFDLIVCRNVLIYFTATAFEQVIDGLSERLLPGGALVLSSAEPLLQPRPLLKAVNVEQAFFYVRRGEPPFSSAAPKVPTPRPLARAITAELPVFNAEAEAVKLFELVLEWAAADAPDAQTEEGLRKALYLAPDLAAARYMLGLLLEQRGQRVEAAHEYARAVASLTSSKALQTAFFLNPERLTKACQLGLVRLGFTS
ncbi:MAG: chemotaxis protein CheR [Myxococcaceae bacterium]|nr:chemotaxis protein CheR [Myxococcaceae bacterium]